MLKYYGPEGISWIDWHPHGDLIACSNRYKFVAVYDRRQYNLVHKFVNLHTGKQNQSINERKIDS